MKDVAEMVGVSKQTVSAVVNNKPGITRETRDRVLAAIDELGYRPDSVARSLATGRTHTIAFIASDVSAPFIGRLAVAAEDYAYSSGYSLVLFNTHDDVEREATYFAAAVQRGVDGVLFISATDQNAGLENLQGTGIPTVAIDRVPVPYSGPSVTLDNPKTGCLAAEHLLSLGHTRIAHIAGPQTVRMSRDRLQGFQQVLEAHDVAPELYVEAAETWDYQAGYDAMHRILADGRNPTAVFAAGDALAIGAVRAIRETGLHVPRDISMIGVDDLDSAPFQNPPLTTIRQSITELAVLGLQLLFDLLDGEKPKQTNIVMEPDLIVRQSTSPPPGVNNRASPSQV
jgi:LacI family repressor for deo operon, udp, cdd, tsx, nupC, and nupG